MSVQGPVRDKLRKVLAVMADRSATDGEKAAADAAATRIRQKWEQGHFDDSGRPAKAAAAIKPGQKMQKMMYRLGRAWGGVRAAGRGEAQGTRGVMYSLGRAWGRVTSKK